MTETDDPERHDPPLDRKISRRTVLTVGVVALPCLVGSNLVFDWLTKLGDTPTTENAEPIVARYDASAHRWGFVVDTNTCIGCGLCVVACKDENHVPKDPEYSRTWVERHSTTTDGTILVDAPEGGINGFGPDVAPLAVAASSVTDARFVPRLCMQCENSPCTAVCPVGATYRTPDGVILVDADRCIGCGYCVVACPYGARYIVPAGGDTPRGIAGVADKCTFCYHRITTGRRPACVEACPVGARSFGDLNDPASPVSVALREKHTKVLKARLGTKPRVLLPRPRRRERRMTVTVAGRELVVSPRVAYRVARAEVARTPRALKAWYGLLLVLMGCGGIGAAFTIAPGTEVFGTTPSFEWGILIAAYVFFAITTSGLCLGSSLGTVFGIDMFRPLEKRHAILAVLSLTTAFGIIALDLHYPVRMVFGAVFNPSLSSPMWWMGAFYAVYLVFLLVEVWSMFTGRDHIHRYACLASSCTAVLAPATLGAVFGVLFARTFWYGLFTPITMLATALLAGSALLGIVFYWVVRLELAGFERGRRLAIPAIRILLAAALTGSLVLLGRQLIVGMTSDDAGLHGATMALLSGPLAIPFWIRLIGGLAIPLVLIALPATRTVGWTGLAAGLVFVGVFVDRLLFVGAGQLIPTTAVGGVVSETYVAYVPSLVEISIVVGAFAFIAFVYTLAERYLDLRESEVHLGFHLPGFVTTARERSAARRAERVARTAAAAAAARAASESDDEDVGGAP